MVDWEMERQRAATVRAFEVWLASEEGRAVMAPFDEITRLEASIAKLRKKIDKLTRRAKG